MRVEPGAEQRRNLERQAHQDVRSTNRSDPGCRRHDRLYLVIGDRGDDRRDVDLRRHPGVDQRPYRCEPPLRMRRSRLERARDLRIERRDRNRDADQIVARHIGEQVDVAQQPVGLGGDQQRMPRLGEHFDHGTRDAPFALDRLIAVGIRADRERSGFVAALRQFLSQEFRGIGFRKQPAFEIEPRRQIVERVRRAREAIDTAVFAAAIGIDRAVEADVGRFISRDDRLGVLDHHRGT